MTNSDNSFLYENDFVIGMNQIVLPQLKNVEKNGTFQDSDGRKIHYEEYLNPKEKAAIVISHGFCEFTKKYEEVIFYFYQAGYSVYIMDHLGHGYSERLNTDLSQVHITSYDEYVTSFHLFIKEIVLKENANRKLVLFAHSMGGAISALYLEEHPTIFTCSILSSPMLEINFGKAPRFLVWLLMAYQKMRHTDTNYAPGSKPFDGIPVFDTSSCLSKARYHYIFNQRLQDEHYQTYGASSTWLIASMKAVKTLQKNVKKINTPILLFQAGADTSVKPGGQIKFAKKTKDTNLIIMKGSKHELFNAAFHTRKDYYYHIFSYLNTYLNF